MPSKTIIAIIAVTIIIVCCIFNDIDGAIVGTGATIIGGLGGFAIGKKNK